MSRIYTYGYAGSDPAALKSKAVELDAVVVDIRFQPFSRDPRWRTKALAELLAPNYMWARSLGNENYKNGGPIKLSHPEDGLRMVRGVFPKHSVILLCVCRDWETCHRRVAAAYLGQAFGAPVEHLPQLVTPAFLKALSLSPPWGTLVAIGAKRWETRSWATSYRGPLAIHQTKGVADLSETDLRKLCQKEPFASTLFNAGYRNTASLPRGAIVSVVDLMDCIRITADNAPPEPERSFGDYSPGRFMWRLENNRPLAQPIPTRGYQQLWTPSGEVVEQLQAAGMLA